MKLYKHQQGFLFNWLTRCLVVDDPSGFSIGDIIEIRQDNDIDKMGTNLTPSEIKCDNWLPAN